MNKRLERLTTRETDIMSVLWNSEEPLLSSQVASISELSTNTVNAVIKKLLNAGMIEVADIVHSGTVLSRRYRPTIAQSDYVMKTFVDQVKSLKKPFSTPQLVANLLDQEEDESAVIAELEAFLKERQKKK